jgi:pSer/pThr/pTyr-binding forkhead associated (FHA) protein
MDSNGLNADNDILERCKDTNLSEDRLNTSYPFLDIQEPDGKEYSIRLVNPFITIGRCADNDINLYNASLIARHHCSIRREGDLYWLWDEGSANCIFVRQGDGGSKIIVPTCDRVLLHDGDVILADLEFWQLRFRDPNVVEPVEGG